MDLSYCQQYVQLSVSALACGQNIDNPTSDGVYRSGFATTQEAYSKAVVELFESLDKLEKILTGKDYLVGGKLTEADVRLWVTIVRIRYFILPAYLSSERTDCGVRFVSILSTWDISNAISGLSDRDILPFTRTFYINISMPQ